MTAFLRIIKQLVAFGDATSTSNPRLRYVDWSRDLSDLRVSRPRSEQHTLAPSEEKTLFDGGRSLLLDGTTAFQVKLLSGTSDTYQVRWTGGTNPGFRTDRALNLSGATVVVTVFSNSTATMAVTSGSFASVQVGDTLWVPGTEEGVTSPFNAANQGFWKVLAASATTLVLTREADVDFEAYGESVSVTSAGQMVAFSATGVQAGDKLDVSAGFAASTQRTFPIVRVTPKYLEVTSTAIVPEETGITPGAAGFLVYTAAKAFVYVEADQDCVIRVNGDTSSIQRVSPWIAGDSSKVGSYERTGPTWSMKVLNRSSVPLNVTVISSE